MATKWVSLDKLRYAISKIHTLLPLLMPPVLCRRRIR